jgi:hypothetical protein
MYGNRLCLNIKTIKESGMVFISGTSVDNISGQVNENDNETFHIDTLSMYLTKKKWYIITSIVFKRPIRSINYEIISLGMYNKLSSNIEILGINADIIKLKDSSPNQSINIQIKKIQDNNKNKITINTIEDITIQHNGIIDNLRGNRGIISSLFESQQSIPYQISLNDYNEYFKNFENFIQSRIKNEGIIIKITWENIESLNLIMRLRPI